MPAWGVCGLLQNWLDDLFSRQKNEILPAWQPGGFFMSQSGFGWLLKNSNFTGRSKMVRCKDAEKSRARSVLSR